MTSIFNLGASLHKTGKKAPTLLPDKTVIEIKNLLAQKKLTQKNIAEKMNVTEAVISRIKKGKTYKSVIN